MSTFRRFAKRRAVAGSVLILCIPALSACVNDDDQVGTIDTAPAMAEGAQDVLPDVRVQDCSTRAGDVTAKGTVLNSAPDARDIVVVMKWTRPADLEPILQLVSTQKAVPAGEEVAWSVSGALPVDADSCVVSAHSGTLQQA